MAYTVTVPRGQEHLLPFPMQRRQPITQRGGLSAAARLAFGKAIKQFAPGGTYGKGVEAALERGRKKATAKGQQALVAAGLAGTTMMAAPGQRYEEEVATPARLQTEETRAVRLADLYAMLAGEEQRGYETMLDVGSRFPTMPYSAPATTDYGYGGSAGVSVPSFARAVPSSPTPTPHRIASAMQRTIVPPPGSPADLWRRGEWNPRPLEEIMKGVQYEWA